MNIPCLFLLSGIALGLPTEFAGAQHVVEPSAPSAKVPGAAGQVLARVRFVPGSGPKKGMSDFKGASTTTLGPGPQKGVLWLQAHAAVGDYFPVVDKAGVKLFEVVVAEGDDDHVVLLIQAKEGSQKVNLPRDKAGAVEVAGIKYDLSYPSISVAASPDEKPTTNKAMLMVTRRL